MPDLKDQIHSLFETGLRPVAAAAIAQRDRATTTPFPLRARRTRAVRRVATATVGLAAAACAVALAVTQLGGVPAAPARPAHPAWPAVIDAAYVRHLAAASQLALAKSGQAVINLTETVGQGQSSATEISTYDLTFSGANWNEWLHFTETEAGMQWVRIIGTRVVDGQAYMFRGPGSCGMPKCSPYWYHVTGPEATSMSVSDPRALLAELSPSAHFVRAGTAVVDGVQVEHLRATKLAGLPAISLPPALTAVPARYQPHFTALEVWVDDHGVVRRVAWSGMQPTTMDEYSGGTGGPAHQLITHGEDKVSEVVTFLSIGQPQVITVPANALPAPPKG